MGAVVTVVLLCVVVAFLSWLIGYMRGMRDGCRIREGLERERRR